METEPQLTNRSRSWLFQLRGYIEACNDIKLKNYFNHFWMTLEWKENEPTNCTPPTDAG